MPSYYKDVKYQFHCDKGHLYILNKGQDYCVVVEFIDDLGDEERKIRFCENWDAAYKKYTEFWKQLNGILPPKKVSEPVSKCTFNGGCNTCRRKNCPAELGGAAYWEIFRNACLFRVKNAAAHQK